MEMSVDAFYIILEQNAQAVQIIQLNLPLLLMDNWLDYTSQPLILIFSSKDSLQLHAFQLLVVGASIGRFPIDWKKMVWSDCGTDAVLYYKATEMWCTGCNTQNSASESIQ